MLFQTRPNPKAHILSITQYFVKLKLQFWSFVNLLYESVLPYTLGLVFPSPSFVMWL